MKTKTFEANDFQVDPNSREVVACISTDAVDRDGEVLLPSGLQKKQYAGNPIVLYGHDSSIPPIGTTRWIKSSGNKVLAKYYISDKTQLGRDVFGLMQDGVLRAHSVGFLDTEATAPTSEELLARPDWKDCRRVVRQWELLEFSVVPIPCNPDCLAIAVAKCSPETRALLGEAFEPAKECCEWETKETPQPVETPEAPEIPQPKYCRSWKSIEHKINDMTARLSVNEVLARLTGKA